MLGGETLNLESEANLVFECVKQKSLAIAWNAYFIGLAFIEQHSMNNPFRGMCLQGFLAGQAAGAS